MKVLVVGFGSIGNRHINNLLKYHDVELIICSSKNSINLESKNFFKTVQSIEQGINEKPDIALITNVTSAHISTAIKLAESGIHLFIEKPLSDSMKGIEKLKKIIQKKKIITMVGCNLRFHPCMKKLKKLITTKKIGRVISVHAENCSYLPDWHPYEDYKEGYSARTELGGGVVLTNIHEIDYLYWIFGNIKSVYSVTGKFSDLQITADDFSYLLLEFKNKILGNVHLNFFQKSPSRFCKIIGTDGIIHCNLLTNNIKIYNSKKKKWSQYLKLKNYNYNDMYVEELRHFINCVRTNKKTINSVNDSINSLNVVINAKKSSKLKTPIRLKLKE